MKRNLFAIFLALSLMVALAFAIVPAADAEATVITPDGLPEVIETNDLILDLQGQKDVEVNVAAGYTLSVIDTTIKGADGYNTAIIPLLEALGCDSGDIKTYEKYKKR